MIHLIQVVSLRLGMSAHGVWAAFAVNSAAASASEMLGSQEALYLVRGVKVS